MYKKLIKKRTPYALLIKIVFILLIAYFIIQLSNEAKRIEEEKAAHQQSTLDFAEKYVNGKYDWDWKALNGDIYVWNANRETCTLRMYLKEEVLKVNMIENHRTGRLIELPTGFAFQTDRNYFILYREYEIENNNYKVGFTYNGSLDIQIYAIDENDSEEKHVYWITYQDGMYIPNIEMEQQLGIPTDEIVALADDTRQLFEEEMLKMHHYQIDKARRNRGRLASAGMLFFVVYLLSLWDKVRRKVKLQGKPTEVCLGEVLANTGAKIVRGKYELLGMGTVFWIYILKPIISEFLLFSLEGQIKKLLAYGISAVLVVLLCVLLFFKGSLNGREPLSIGLCFIRIFRTLLGIVIAVSLINLGVGLVSDFYPHSWQFYVINYMVASVTAGILCIWDQIKRRREEDVR